MRTWPLPPAEVLERFYEDPGYFGARTVGARDAWAQRAWQILSLLPERPAAVLDFGAGEGHLVLALRNAGVEAAGVEPSPTARANALRKQGIELLASIDDLRARRFSSVTMLHSLEHVADPLGTLRGLRAVLHDGASMYVEVPHAGSADMWIPKSRRAILDLPAHLHHFTPGTLAQLARSAGYSVLAVQLFNARPIEAAMNRPRRQRHVHRGPASAPLTEPVAASPSIGVKGGVERLLAQLRSALPGPKFSLLLRLEGHG